MVQPTKYAEVRRILERYLVEVVERYGFCPWATSARVNHEIGVEVVWGTPAIDDFVDAIDRSFAAPTIRVAMIVAPELTIDLRALHTLRNRVAEQRPAYGIAEFHPAGAIDLATPARLVPWLRRSPDPLLQCVPLTLLETVRAKSQPDRMLQAQIIQGLAKVPRDVEAQIAEANHATTTAHRAQIEAVLDDITRDRDAAYARAFSACR